MNMHASKVIGWVVFSLLVSAKAQAFLTPCQLDQTSLPATVNSSFIKDYQQKLRSECYLQKRYEAAANKISGTYAASLDDVTVYKALRYIDRWAYAAAKSYSLPVPYIYQKQKVDYNLPVSQRSSEIWFNWIAGMGQLSGWIEQRSAGKPMGLSELSALHKGFYTLSKEEGDFANTPNIGQLKPPSANDRSWFKIPPEQVAETRDVIYAINSRYETMGLLASQDRMESDIHLPLRLRQLNDGVYVYGGDSRKNTEHLNNLFRFLNQMLDQGRQGQHMVWQGRPMTPGEVALFVQQFFVQIHPFNDGNGRTSRFFQDAVLKMFGLPYLASGDLMAIDVMTAHENYYYISMGKTFEHFDRIEECINNVYPRLFFRSGDLKKVSPDNIEYDCRLL
jgi:hypothetical protein